MKVGRAQILPRIALASAALAFLSAPDSARAQGCVAVRGAIAPPGSSSGQPSAETGSGDWLLNVSYRWLQSDRHFRGDTEERHRQKEGTEVINDSHFIDVSAIYSISPRFSAALVAPFVYSERSSLYEHDREHRHSSEACGIGDMRIAGYGWIREPSHDNLWNVNLGLGIKAPTGDYEADDIFYTADGPERRNVDQSIQPGDGGWGVTAEVFGYAQIAPRLSAYFQGFYLSNPRDTNGAATNRSNPYEADMSVPDQFSARAGLAFEILPSAGLAVGLGARIDGVPVRDLIGGSNGFRRPGFAVAVEPGIFWHRGDWAASVTVPVAVHRNRQRSVADKRLTDDTGVYRHGDAAFADFFVSASITRRF
ncbi:MAG: transporter [Verrucomicrobiales bacterium]